MPPPCSLAMPPLPAEPTIARSRSRYKGPRLQKTLLKSSATPSFTADHIRQVDSLTIPPREPRPEHRIEERERPKIQPSRHETMQRRRDFSDDAQRSDAFVPQKQGSSKKAKDRTHLRDYLVSPPQTLQGFQQAWQRSECRAEAELLKEAGKDTVPTQRVPTSPEQCSLILGPDLRPSHEKEAAATIGSPAFPGCGISNRTAGHSYEKRLHKARDELKKTTSAPIAIDSPQTTAKPAFDAPVSAVNAGERRVKVKSDQNLISLPVTPSTTPLDIIRSATDQLAESMDPTSSILFESFKQLGIERPLRKYEHVRDVLNSWDNDSQNILVIKSSPTVGRDDWYDLQCVSTFPLVDTSVYMYYSQRPGHWDKRWVTLRSDGQMLVAKKEGGESTNICHMSDFDIYIPTAPHSAKRIRPPRKICFAVKSQQKSSMFLSTANFVHFFSTSDKTLAAIWYKAVLEWRSWYLWNVMGEGEGGPWESKDLSMKMDQTVSVIGSSILESQERPQEPPFQGRRTKQTFTLARNDTERLAPFTKPESRHNVAGDDFNYMPFRSRSKNHLSPSTKLTKGSTDSSASRDHGPSFKQVIRSEDPEPFVATGLLGRTYTQRQKVQREREKAQDADSENPRATPNLNPLNQLNRTPSQHPKPKPLIDLTPQYQEPPQHAKKGRGVTLDQIPAGGLVEVANTPEAAITVPPSTTWHRPSSKCRDVPSVGRSSTVQRDHSSGRPSELKQISTSPEKPDMAFKGGLVAINSRGQGGARTGRGIMSGDRQAKEPMLNVKEKHQYAPGSLLERGEK